MAELWYGHFDSTAEDPRKMIASEWAAYISSFITDGIRNGGTTLQVTENQAMTVKVDTGIANIKGYIMQLREDFNGRYYQVAVPAAHPQYPRIDRLVLRLDRRIAARNIKPIISMGVASANPIPPVLTRTDTEVYELSLAQIRVNANAVGITQANITDERFNTELCGLMNSILGLDPSSWQLQFDEIMRGVEHDNTVFREIQQAAWEAQTAKQQTDFDGFKADWQAQTDNQQSVWETQTTQQQTQWQGQTQTQQSTWEAQTTQQQADFDGFQTKIDAWRDLTTVELAKQVSFNFDNADIFPGCRKVTTFSVNKMLSEWRVTGSNKLVARREFDFATMTKVTELFAEDGVTVVQRRVVVTEYGDAIITSVYDGGQSDPVSVHNAAPVTHTNMLVDGGTVDIADNKITTLEEHIVDGYAHQNIIIDGNSTL